MAYSDGLFLIRKVLWTQLCMDGCFESPAMLSIASLMQPSNPGICSVSQKCRGANNIRGGREEGGAAIVSGK